MDHLANEAEIEGLRPGRVIIIPSSFQGSPRAMQQNYQDAMAIVRKYGKPDLFITFTCNPIWRKVEEQLFPGQTPSDRPDLKTYIRTNHSQCLRNRISKAWLTTLSHAYYFGQRR
ncbi:unnamed protein product [Rotaria sordida]|uniref:Helitron helicase-like domain-containing protein n=1 Tax=Rotaria sordida TaxID=392033 RepID=A0A819UM14_9BILA|nr:unnamed protein product [Rotaria sordida]